MGIKRIIPAIGPSFSAAEHIAQIFCDRLRVSAFHGHETKRHATHRVDVEHRDDVPERRDVLRVAEEGERVARFVGAHDAAMLDHRLQHPLDLGGGDVVKLNDVRAVADERVRILILRGGDRGAGDRRLIQRHDLIEAAGTHQRPAGDAERGLEEVQRRRFAHGMRGVHGNLAVEVGVDDVVDAENVAENHLHRLPDRHIDEIERDIGVARPVKILPSRTAFADEPTRAGNHERALAGGSSHRGFGKFRAADAVGVHGENRIGIYAPFGDRSIARGLTGAERRKEYERISPSNTDAHELLTARWKRKTLLGAALNTP